MGKADKDIIEMAIRSLEQKRKGLWSAHGTMSSNQQDLLQSASDDLHNAIHSLKSILSADLPM